MLNITEKQFKDAIEKAFKEGESWGITYSTWFTPTEMDTKMKIETSQNNAISNLKLTPCK